MVFSHTHTHTHSERDVTTKANGLGMFFLSDYNHLIVLQFNDYYNDDDNCCLAGQEYREFVSFHCCCCCVNIVSFHFSFLFSGKKI